MKRLLNWKPSLLTSFSLLGGIITVVIAVALALGLEYQLEQNALQQEAASAADQVALILGPNLTPADLTAALSPARLTQIDTLIRQEVLQAHVVRIKIWNTAGLLIYSDDASLVGQSFPKSDELEKALDGHVATEVSTLNQAENVGERPLFSRLLEVYVPIRLGTSTQVVGAYEIYHDLSVLDPLIASTRRFVWLGVGLGFLVLYGSLFVLVRNASHELTRRNNENKRLFEEEQTRRSELAALYGLSRALADARDARTTLSTVTRHAVETVHVTFARIALLEGDEFVIRAVYPVRDMGKDLQANKPASLGARQVCQRVLASNEPEVLAANSPGLSPEEREALFLSMAETICLVPLRVGERWLGLLMFGEARSPQREPFSADKLRLARSIGEQAASALERVGLFAQLEQSYLQTVLALANAVDAKDTYTADHAQRLAQMALAVGGQLGMGDHELEALRYGAILHDIGKIGVPDAVLQKPGKLDATEWAAMRQHPVIGAGILAPVPQLAGAAQIVRHHHERFDGKGYPDGLAGDAIPLGARILTVVDSYSAITDKRVYKEARPAAVAISELERYSGTQFDPQVVQAFLGTEGQWH
jgi:HD-GYP domain-containing protein (c-di-GMP phosphodiesterase class II)